MGWDDLLTRWDLIEADLQDRGVDIGDRALMAARPWRWLRVRIVGLLRADTRIGRALAPDEPRR
ncbi:hypothetical protein O3438_16750 [Micromonospora sp. WMMC250]|nr:hypothetical protein [Micromonospora sp. WMMC250]MCZ7376551.1 hypothetical protein [Micromonospora sp. WMMC250]